MGSRQVHPVQVCHHLTAQREDTRILAIDAPAGDLRQEFKRRNRTLLGSCSDFYGKELSHQVRVIRGTKPGWRAVFERFRFTDA